MPLLSWLLGLRGLVRWQRKYRGLLRMIWRSDEEKKIYRQAVRVCLLDPRIERRLDARPEVTAGTVMVAMSTDENIDRALLPCMRTHFAYRRVFDKLESSRDLVATVEAKWDGRVALLFATVALTLLSWIRGSSFLYAILALLVLNLGALLFALRSADARSQLWRWMVALLLSMPQIVLRPWLYFRTRRWSHELIRKGLAPCIAQVVDELLGEDRDSLLLPDSYEGLRLVHGHEYFVSNGASGQLKRKIKQIDGGTIAVSGPRGVGKTTLLESCVEAGDFAVFAHAPATYAPHEFLTSLFVRVCEEYIGREGHAVPEFNRLPQLRRSLRRLVAPAERLLRWLVYAVPAGGLVTLGLFATVRSFQAEHGQEVRSYVLDPASAARAHAMDVWSGRAVGTGLAVTFVGILIWRLRRSEVTARVLGRLRRLAFILVVYALMLGPIASLGFDPEIRHHLRSFFRDGGSTAWCLALVVFWLLCSQQYSEAWKGPISIWRWRVARRRFFGPLRNVISLVFLVLVAGAEAGWATLNDAENPLRICIWLLGVLLKKFTLRPWVLIRPEPSLVTECRNYLYRLKTVQSSSAAVNTGAAQLLNLGTSHTASLSTIPPNYPELVADFRDLLTWMARQLHIRQQRLIIAIDEVDRLGTGEQALAFLSEIKAILGIPYVHYLISVADDVGASFVRRGLPHRDATDSSLDDVVHVQPGVLAESAAILNSRAPGISGPYIILAHALSGGIPRDLIRYGRRLMEIQETTSHLELTDISRVMILEELSETLAGFRTLLAKQQWSPNNSLILGSFRSLMGHLRTACPCSDREEQLQQAMEHFAIHAAQGQASSDQRDLPGDARQLIDEASAYAYFSFTLLGIFGPEEFNRRRKEAARRGLDGDPEALAEARLELSISPYSARPLIDAIRVAWNLTESGTAAAAIPPPRRMTCPVHAGNR
ncbi:P-loop NTPase fold protein [Streptomyces sp. NPDC058373]|uniref:P-loop NTPase fold protein n=1 Tax=Streptomyces sp. NPDC058373 TaxID=3346465 RepID=UPI00366264B5